MTDVARGLDLAPMRRSGRAGELDSLLLTLLHPSGSYLTGQVIAVDGGMDAS